MTSPRRIGCKRWILYGALVLIAVCGGTLAVSALSNRSLPEPPADLERLTAVDQARIAEAFHLKETLGDQVWPGWGGEPIPVLVWNQEYAFLYAMPEPPPGWDALSDQTFAGLPVYRQAGTERFEAFTEQVIDGVWVGSMSTKWEMDRFFIDQFRGMIPAPLDAVFPYRVLILPSEVYISGMLHETFHAYQAIHMPDRFADAESAYPDKTRYTAADGSMRDAWSAEIGLLADALKADTDAEAADLARQFLEARAERRTSAGLDADLIAYEQRFEWLEGLAKYVELGIYEAAARSAAQAPEYAPVPEMDADPLFDEYEGFDQRWQQEMIAMRNPGNQTGDVRFYYTGMAQARLLDRLLPGWQDRIAEQGVWLEDLLADAAGE